MIITKFFRLSLYVLDLYKIPSLHLFTSENGIKFQQTSIVVKFNRYFSNHSMNNKLVDYLTLKGVTLNTDSVQDQLIIEILEQRQQEMSNLYEQITKYKCEESKNQKLIKSLQEKIALLAPSISDTGSNFMMASQFKTNFEELMTTLIPSALGGVMDRPYLFAKCVEDIFMLNYCKVEQTIADLVINICKLMRIDKNSQSLQMQSKIKIALLKIMQECWQNIVPFEGDSLFQYKNKAEQNNEQLIAQLNELLNAQEYKEMRQTLHKIVVYMVLQDKKWEFSNLNNRQIVKFSKKDFVCIDGWVKEGDQSLLVLGGLKRDNHQHPNLKNFVIPYQAEEKTYEYYKLFTLNVKKEQSDKKQSLSQNPIVLQDTPKILAQKIETFRQPLEMQMENSINVTMLVKNKSLQSLKQNKQNNPHLLNKKPKKKEKLKILQNSLKDQKSPSSRRRQDESIKRGKLKSEEKKQLADDKILMMKDDVFSKKKQATMVVNKNISNSHQTMFQDVIMLPLKRKAFEDLPVSKQIPLRKKTKPTTSRKNSVGKIVNQQHIIHNNEGKDKQNSNTQMNGVKSKNKQKLYKDIIKQKLFQEKASDKAHNSLTLIHARAKNEKQKKNDENRPLKIQSNANKLRQKYVY